MPTRVTLLVDDEVLADFTAMLANAWPEVRVNQTGPIRRYTEQDRDTILTLFAHARSGALSTSGYWAGVDSIIDAIDDDTDQHALALARALMEPVRG